jgi:hypothetical protein
VDVVKVDRDVAYVPMFVHVCCKLLFPMFHLIYRRKCVYFECCICFRTYVASVLSGCCVWFSNGFNCFQVFS